MKLTAITLALAGGLFGTAAIAQTTTPPTAAPGATPGTTGSVMPSPANPSIGTGPAAAGGDRNQAVATTSANATEPAKGANSFTEGEARRRIEGQGYSDVADLQKDGDGIWRGSAKKGGNTVKVWLDYKGNVGNS